MQFILEIFDNVTECIEHEVRFDAGGDEIAACLVSMRSLRMEFIDLILLM